jgi:hypothetical protein
MSTTQLKSPRVHFLTTFAFPALLVFLVPVLSYFFFRHAQGRFDDETRVSALNQIRADRTLTEEQRARAIELFTQVPFSQLLSHEEIAAALPSDTAFTTRPFVG